MSAATASNCKAFFVIAMGLAVREIPARRAPSILLCCRHLTLRLCRASTRERCGRVIVVPFHHCCGDLDGIFKSVKDNARGEIFRRAGNDWTRALGAHIRAQWRKPGRGCHSPRWPTTPSRSTGRQSAGGGLRYLKPGTSTYEEFLTCAATPATTVAVPMT